VVLWVNSERDGAASDTLHRRDREALSDEVERESLDGAPRDSLVGSVQWEKPASRTLPASATLSLVGRPCDDGSLHDGFREMLPDAGEIGPSLDGTALAPESFTLRRMDAEALHTREARRTEPTVVTAT